MQSKWEVQTIHSSFCRESQNLTRNLDFHAIYAKLHPGLVLTDRHTEYEVKREHKRIATHNHQDKRDDCDMMTFLNNAKHV